MSDSRGFTLAEVIIAIALLAVCSVYILEMFVVSDSLSDDTYRLDGAISNANNICQYLKASDSPEEFLSNPYIVMRGSLADGIYRDQLYFDSKWRQVESIEGCSVVLDMAMDFSDPANLCVMELQYSKYQNGRKEDLFDLSVNKYFAQSPAGEASS